MDPWGFVEKFGTIFLCYFSRAALHDSEFIEVVDLALRCGSFYLLMSVHVCINFTEIKIITG